MDAEIVFGPPGTGKTTYLVNRAKEFVNIYKKKVLFLSFTRAAAIEAQSRINSDLVNVRTIHSLGYQVAGISRGQVVDFRKLGEFGRKVGFPIKGGDLDSEEGIADGDRLLAIMNLAIAKKQSLSTTYMESDRPVNFKSFEFFVNSYINWKAQFGYVDFNDMLLMFPEEPIQCDSVIVDESQDLSPLQWEVISKLLLNCKRCVIAGDDDQCQPTGTMVLAPDGEKPIEMLVDGDRVISFSPGTKKFESQKIKVSSRHVTEDIIQVTVGGSVSKYTKYHKCMVRSKDFGDVFRSYAINLDPKSQEMAVYKDGVLNWMEFTTCVEFYIGFVFSLEVENTGTYIADRIYTHNSIYEWGGADIHGLQKFETSHHAKRTILGQSYRVPKSVHKLSQDLISRIDGRVEKTYLPTEVEGEVKKYGSPDLVKYNPKVETLVLYRNHMFRKELESVLINNHIPYVADAGFPSLMDNKYGKGIRSFKKLKNGEPVTGLELNQIKNVANPRVAGLIKDRNFKALPDSWKLAIYVPHIWSNYYSRVDMTAEPKLHISSIHGSKGREADRVIVHTGLTQRTYQGLGEDPDPETRVFYVAITRARHQLDLIDGVRGFQI